jgi:hypothetical protein
VPLTITVSLNSCESSKPIIQIRLNSAKAEIRQLLVALDEL